MKISRLTIAGALVLGMLTQSGAAPGEGIQLEEWNLSPYGSLQLTQDSNVFLDEDGAEQADDSYQYKYGVYINRPSETLGLSVYVWGLTKQYDTLESLDRTDFGESASLDITTPGGTTIFFRQSYSNVEDVDYLVGERAKFSTHRVSVSADRDVTDKTNGKLTYRFKAKNHDADTLNDWWEHLLRGTVSHDVTEQSDVFGAIESGVQDSDGNRDKSAYYNVLLGMSTRWTDKITASAAAGVVGVNSDIADISEPSFEGYINWAVADRINLSAGAERYIEPASIDDDNFDKVTVLRTDLTYRILTSLRISVSLRFYDLELANPYITGTGDVIDKREDVFTASAGLNYQSPAKFLVVFVEGRVTDQDSTEEGGDYTEDIVSFGARVLY